MPLNLPLSWFSLRSITILVEVFLVTYHFSIAWHAQKHLHFTSYRLSQRFEERYHSEHTYSCVD